MKTTSDPARWEIMKRYRCPCGSHSGGGNAIEEQQVAAQKYPKARQSRTGDKTICLPYSATELPRRDLERGTMTALCSQSFAESTVPHFRDDIKVGYVSMKLWFVNRVGDFLKQLHANMTDQPFAVVEDPAAPRARAGAKTLLHP